MAARWSFLLPGVGQLLAGDLRRGLPWLFGHALAVFLACFTMVELDVQPLHAHLDHDDDGGLAAPLLGPGLLIFGVISGFVAVTLHFVCEWWTRRRSGDGAETSGPSDPLAVALVGAAGGVVVILAVTLVGVIAATILPWWLAAAVVHVAAVLGAGSARPVFGHWAVVCAALAWMAGWVGICFEAEIRHSIGATEEASDVSIQDPSSFRDATVIRFADARLQPLERGSWAFTRSTEGRADGSGGTGWLRFAYFAVPIVHDDEPRRGRSARRGARKETSPRAVAAWAVLLTIEHESRRAAPDLDDYFEAWRERELRGVRLRLPVARAYLKAVRNAEEREGLAAGDDPVLIRLDRDPVAHLARRVAVAWWALAGLAIAWGAATALRVADVRSRKRRRPRWQRVELEIT